MTSYQSIVSRYYKSTPTQVCVALLIGANFIANIVEKEIDPDGIKHNNVFGALEICFNVLFTIELAMNMYGHWFFNFWKDVWNWFDFVVVSIGLVTMMDLPLPPSLSLLRMMRAFRVFRLFKRVKSLNKIIVAIMLAIPGVANAFVILTIIMCIYAILGVEFFKDVGEDCLLASSSYEFSFETTRGDCIGREYFGTFLKSLYSFFQVMTGDSWSEAIGRPVVWSFSSPIINFASAFYFVSFVLVTTLILINVVVAVLLDKMVDPEVDVEGLDEEFEMDAPEEATASYEWSDGAGKCEFLASTESYASSGYGQPQKLGVKAERETKESGDGDAGAGLPVGVGAGSGTATVANCREIITGTSNSADAAGRNGSSSKGKDSSTSQRGSATVAVAGSAIPPHAQGCTLHARMALIEHELLQVRSANADAYADLRVAKAQIKGVKAQLADVLDAIVFGGLGPN